MRDIVAARDLAQLLSVDIASTESFAFLVFGQFRFATELDAAGLGARTSFTGARADQISLELGQAAEHVENRRSCARSVFAPVATSRNTFLQPALVSWRT